MMTRIIKDIYRCRFKLQRAILRDYEKFGWGVSTLPPFNYSARPNYKINEFFNKVSSGDIVLGRDGRHYSMKHSK